ncbi:MAG: thioredoxin family protein [Planctomycetota bacterium]
MRDALPIPRSRRPACAAVLLAAGLAGVGCSVRDERAVGKGDAAWWATTADESRAGLIGGSPAQPPAAAAIDYEEGFDAAVRRAAETGKPTLLVFRAAWCRWSGDLLSAAAGDPRIVARARRCVCVAVDADRDRETCARYGVRAFPTVILLDAAGEETFRRTGSSAIGSLAEAIDDVLDTAATARRIAETESATRR